MITEHLVELSWPSIVLVGLIYTSLGLLCPCQIALLFPCGRRYQGLGRRSQGKSIIDPKNLQLTGRTESIPARQQVPRHLQGWPGSLYHVIEDDYIIQPNLTYLTT